MITTGTTRKKEGRKESKKEDNDCIVSDRLWHGSRHAPSCEVKEVYP